MTLKDYVITVLAILVVASCDSDKCATSPGEEVSKVILNDTFNIIEIKGLFNIELVQDTSYFVEAVVGENILKNIEARLKNDTLILFNHTSCSWMNGYVIPLLRVHFDDLNSIHVLESANIFSKQSLTDNFVLIIKAKLAEANIIFNSDRFIFYNYKSSGGKYVFSGRMEELHLEGFYTAYCDASELRCKRALIKNFSIVDYKVWVEDKLTVEIHNRGNIFYKGTPEIVVDSLTGTGIVKPM